ncbi:Gfo/Idh/MocA family oxidoreductase [Acidobacteriota bacterium]
MKKNIAVVGCGYWGKNLVRNFYELDSLYAICDADSKILKTFKEKYDGIVTYTDYSRLLKDESVEGIVISTPAVTHFSLASEALEAGKDVFVEKPIALNYQEGLDLVEQSKKEKRILMVGHILEYHPAIHKLKTLIDKGELGQIQYIYSNRLNLGKFRTEENILWSFAPHDISVIIGLLGEMPYEVYANGGNYLNRDVTDVTTTSLNFKSGVKAHIFVSWLHPYKEQKLVVIGDKKMIVFDDVNPDKKLSSYSHKIDWIGRLPVPQKLEAESIEIDKAEPLKQECRHFIECMETRSTPTTDGENGLRVLKILEACQSSLRSAKTVSLNSNSGNPVDPFIHETAIIDDNVEIGKGTKIWHFCHVLKNTQIGQDCVMGQNVMAGPNVSIGNNVKIQNNVALYEGVILEDDVFCGPSMVFTNVTNPRSHWSRKDEYKQTLVKQGASLGANSTIVCGHTIGRYAFVGAGALVNKDIPDYALVYGVPARIQGWMCYCGTRLDLTDSSQSKENAACSHCGREYEKEGLEVCQIRNPSE